MGNIEYKDVIKSISYNQHEILYNICKLHNNNNKFECDITYSSGKFYEQDMKFPVEQPLIKMDVFPQTDDTIKIEPLGKLPLDDNSISSIVIDPPFVIAPKNSASTKREGKQHNIIQKRFASFYPKEELFESYHHLIMEAYRVLKGNGLLVFKCQNTISARQFLCNEEYAWLCMEQAGFHIIDRAIVLAKNRLHSGKIKVQEHFRNYTSCFWVARKSSKKKIDYFNWKK